MCPGLVCSLIILLSRDEMYLRTLPSAELLYRTLLALGLERGPALWIARGTKTLYIAYGGFNLPVVGFVGMNE